MINDFNPVEYLDYLQSKGISSFTSDEYRAALKLSKDSAKVSLHRLKKKKLIVSPAQGFNLILTPEYRKLGSLPPELFIDSLMKHLKINYYVGLLSAAEKLGASHHRPQVFQVLLDRQRRNLTSGQVVIQFLKRSVIQELPIMQKSVKTGYFNISSAELTAFDLVGYQKQAGGLQNVLTVLEELAEVIDPRKLLKVGRRCPIAWSQRLGFLLALLDKQQLLAGLSELVKQKARVYVPLVYGVTVDKENRSKDWRIFINENIELD